MIEEKGQMIKSIGFPVSVLACTDKAAEIFKTSRSALTIKALKEYIKNHNLEEKTGIRI